MSLCRSAMLLAPMILALTTGTSALVSAYSGPKRGHRQAVATDGYHHYHYIYQYNVIAVRLPPCPEQQRRDMRGRCRPVLPRATRRRLYQLRGRGRPLGRSAVAALFFGTAGPGLALGGNGIDSDTRRVRAALLGRPLGAAGRPLAGMSDMLL